MFYFLKVKKSHSTTFLNQFFISYLWVFPAVMYGCESFFIESWAPKNWCFWTAVLEKPLESPLDCKKIQPVNLRGDQSWIFTAKTDAETETPTLWPPDAKSWLTGKDPDAGKDWGQEKGTTEDEMVGWHHRLDGHEFEWTPGVGDGQGGLVCCSPWGSQSQTQLSDWTDGKWYNSFCRFKIMFVSMLRTLLNFFFLLLFLTATHYMRVVTLN